MGSNERRKGPEAIGPVIEKIISGLGLRELLTSGRVFEVWNSVVGSAIARHAQPHTLRNGTLVVNVDSSVWLAQLDRFRKNQIRGKLNRCLPHPIVKRIVFRIGEVKSTVEREEKG